MALDFDQIWNAVRQLNDDELQRLRNLLDALLTIPALRSNPLDPDHQVDLALMKRGLMSRIPPPITDLTPYQNRKPIEIQGKPLSETIIEERRQVAVYFFDTSAIVKRYIVEIGFNWVNQLVHPTAGNIIRLVRLTTVEVVSAIARRQRGGGIAPADAAMMLRDFRYDLANQYRLIELSPLLVAQAAYLAETHALRGSDAVQLAAALEANAGYVIQGVSLTLVSADAELNAAAVAEGLAVDDPNLHP